MGPEEFAGCYCGGVDEDEVLVGGEVGGWDGVVGDHRDGGAGWGGLEDCALEGWEGHFLMSLGVGDDVDVGMDFGGGWV